MNQCSERASKYQLRRGGKMQYMICRYCKHENCMIRARECPRHRAIALVLIDVVADELPKLHRHYDMAEKEWEDDD